MTAPIGALARRGPGGPPAALAARVAAGLGLWVALYLALGPLSRAIARGALGLDPASPLGQAVEFFLHDAPKVILLLALVVFVMTTLRSFLTPERTRAVLAGRREWVGNVLGALLGIATPFCSCSAVSLFIGFVSAGVPLGVTLSFLISAPMVNEVALALLLSMFGWKVAGLYLGFGLAVAIGAGWLLGRMGLERHIEGWVREQRAKPAAAAVGGAMDWEERVAFGLDGVRDIVGRTWPFIAAGIAVGAFIHGYVPAATLSRVLGRDAWWSVPLAAVIGVPIYSNAAGTLPVVQALLGKGVALGTALAFMMAVVALSLPELIILRRVMRPPLMAAFVAVVTAGIIVVGYLFNWLS
jgi:hypothetical protein